MSQPRRNLLLLPGELREGHDARRSTRDWIVDVLMFLIAIAIGVAVLADTWEEHSELALAVDVAVGLAALVALWWRRPHADAVGALAVGASIFSALAAGPGLVAVFNSALRGSRRGRRVVVGLCGLVVTVFPLLYSTGDTYVVEVVIGALLTAAVFGWGLFARVRREELLALRERAQRAAEEQHLRVAQAREAERRRIAREMHDVLAHRVSLLSLQAGALEFRPDAPPAEIAEAAGVIRAAARSVLEELREVIGVLREGPEAETPEKPQPTLTQIPLLVDEVRAAGTRVTCRIDVEGTRDASAVLGRTAYRVVQEGLTNARKHAPGAAVAVTVSGGERLVVEVVSRRPVGVMAGEPLPGAGAGLIGLAERVAIAGGELEHGPGTDGDFVLRATLPWAT